MNCTGLMMNFSGYTCKACRLIPEVEKKPFFKKIRRLSRGFRYPSHIIKINTAVTQCTSAALHAPFVLAVTGCTGARVDQCISGVTEWAGGHVFNECVGRRNPLIMIISYMFSALTSLLIVGQTNPSNRLCCPKYHRPTA